MDHSRYFSDRRAAVSHLRSVIDGCAVRAEITRYICGWFVTEERRAAMPALFT